MEEDKFKLIDGILSTKGFREDRQVALDMLAVGVREGTLVDVAKVVARRYALQPEAVIEWYGEVLKRLVKEILEIRDKLKELTK